MNLQIEKQLSFRLKILGFILLAFAVAALAYILLPEIDDEISILEQEIAVELQEPAPLNPFLVSSVFALVGSSCLFIAWKKRKSLFSTSPENQDSE